MKTIFDFMNLAIEAAKKSKGVPIGALLLSQTKKNNKFIYKKKEFKYVVRTNNKFHAEIEVFLNKNINQQNLDIFITQEPCPMCMFFLMEKNVKRIFFANYNPNYGSCGGQIHLKSLLKNQKKIKIYGGLLVNSLLLNFFKNQRCKKKKEN